MNFGFKVVTLLTLVVKFETFLSVFQITKISMTIQE